MSKIGRRLIPLSSAKVEIKDGKIFIDGPKAKFTHELPKAIEASIDDGSLALSIKDDTRENRMLWGLHRALLANKVKGVLDMGYKPIYQLITEDGREINTTGNHPYLVKIHPEVINLYPNDLSFLTIMLYVSITTSEKGLEASIITYRSLNFLASDK